MTAEVIKLSKTDSKKSKNRSERSSSTSSSKKKDNINNKNNVSDEQEKEDSQQPISKSQHFDDNDDKNKKRKRTEDKIDSNVNASISSKGEMDEEKKNKKSTMDAKEERKAKKAKKKAEKEALLSKVPKTDENGIAYTKVQIKRMVKRLKRGLDPVPTEQEERERIRQLKLEKEEEEKELAGMMYRKPVVEKTLDEDDYDDDEEEENQDCDNNDEEDEKDNNDDGGALEKTSEDMERPRKKARSKPVPSDYTCMACQNKHQPLHWIYDCPDKIYKPGANKLKKKLRGIHDPASRKVFISGLPFDVKTKDVEMYFEKEMKCGKVKHCKLLQFEDTNRCKGTGFLTFETDEGAKNALKLNGSILSLPAGKDETKKSKKGEKIQKELRLGVKKLLNRIVTSKSKSM